MRSPVLVALSGVLSASVTATPVAPAAPRPNPHIHPIRFRQDNGINSTVPCAQVSQALYGGPNGPTPSQPVVPAKLAYDCIKSVPFHASSAKALLKALPSWIQWQSTLAFLKDPPDEYAQKIQPPVDILGGLDKLAADIDAGKFTSEYDFGWALYTLILSAHDGHFSYVPDSVGAIFSFGRKVPLVSVSEDGVKLPSVFAFPDVLGLQFKNITYTPSPVVEIDGQDVTKFLEDLSQHGSLQDRDALYNNLFYELAQVSLGPSGSGTGAFTGGGRGRFVYPGPTTTLKFANGTTYTMENYARVLVPFRYVQSGQDLATQWFTFASDGFNLGHAQDILEAKSHAKAYSKAQAGDEPGLGATAPGYPSPVVAGPSNLINGFYIDAPGYEDVAVLQVPSFVADESAELLFQRTTQKFLPKAKADGKTKLIIDVQANGGGTILQGYDMFKQLFPSLTPVGLDQFRATEPLNLIGQSFSEFASQFPRVPTTNATIKAIQGSYFDYHSDTDISGVPFVSWQDKFGPVTSNDEYTSISRWNLSDVFVQYSSGGINITGYGPLANVSHVTPFGSEQIVLLTDGYCASTCTIFAEFLSKISNVKTIALGGRSNKKPIQAIGGVKGTNNYGWATIQNFVQTAVQINPKLSNSSVLKEYYDDLVFFRSATGPGCNVRNGLPIYDPKAGIPLQFIYEEADCRLYYTPEMTVDATAMWKAAADASWGKNGKCVKDGYGKREEHEATTSLKRRRVKARSAAALLRKLEVFEKSFELETDCQWEADGFMRP